MLFSKYKIFHQMCSHDAGNVIQEPLNLKFLYKPPPPSSRQNQNSTPMNNYEALICHMLFAINYQQQ